MNSVFSYLPETKSENSVPGFEKESSRYQKESLLKSSSDLGVVCFGTKVSFNEKIVPKKLQKKLKTLIFRLVQKLKEKT